MLIGGWDNPLALLRAELEQLEYEGVRIPDAVRERVEMLGDGDRWNEAAIGPIHRDLENLAPAPDFPYEQPNDLDAIRRLRPSGPVLQAALPGDDAMLDRFHGAWLGRAVGCALGKPVEGLGMSGGWRGIKRYLENRGDYPLADYFSGRDVGDGMKLWCLASLREGIQYMESDDDIRYTLIGLLLFERHGAAFTWLDVARLWNAELPMSMVCTAERQALINYNLRGGGIHGDGAVTPAFTRRFNNPYREWIGAQIRADFFGWAAAGNPGLAAEYAWRDASWTHVKNGIYGEMFFAALQAAAFVESGLDRLLDAGLAQIPARCRLAREIAAARDVFGKLGDFEAFLEWFEKRFAGMSPVHTVNNAVLCVAALHYGRLDPDRSVCLSVAGGLDTDCNGATVGAVCGIVRGHAAFGGTLAGRLNDTVKAEFGEFRTATFADLARRTLAVWRKAQVGG